MRFSRSLCASALAAFCIAAPAVGQATLATNGFEASLDTGPLQGTVFPGSFSYDLADTTGHGEEFVLLRSLDFTLLGVPFTRDEIDQGGQAILEDGKVSYFTAAFFPPPPENSPVSVIAFGFGGPGVIGYGQGLGHYVITAKAVPEMDTGALLALGIAALVTIRGRRRKAAGPGQRAAFG